MREPTFCRDGTPFSQASSDRLRNVVCGVAKGNGVRDDGSIVIDRAFAKEWAARILAERGGT